jgi:flagellar hook assembly protein FlgD
MTSAITAQSVQDPTASNTTKAAAPSTLGQDAFLKLLVAQLQHQDPLNPTDGMTFVSQLAQFSELEATLGMRDELGQLVKLATPTTPAESTPASTGS